MANTKKKSTTKKSTTKTKKDTTKKTTKKSTAKSKVATPKDIVVDESVVVKTSIEDDMVDSHLPNEEKNDKAIIDVEDIVDNDSNNERDGNSIEPIQEAGKEKKKDMIKAPRIIHKEETESSKKKKKKEPVEIVRYTPSAKDGLTTEQVIQRKEEGRVNVVSNKNTKTYKSIIFGNIFTFFNILCFAVAISLIVVHCTTITNYVFLLIALANTGIGIIQEIKAKKTIEKISLVSSPNAIVVRDKEERKIPVDELVLDDIIFLQTGKQICADSIVIDGSVEVNESLLTGESISIKKNKGDILYSGSFVVGGKCFARVERVGNDTYTAKLAAQAKKYQKPKSELMGTLNTIIKVLGFIIIPLAVLIVRNNYQLTPGDNILKVAEKSAGAIIGMIPSGMFLLTSMALAVGVIKLAKRRTLVQDLYSIEMLARTDVLCLDKTGTITDGTMKVSNVIQVKTDFKYTLEHLIGSMLTALDDNNQTSRALITHFGYSKEFTATHVLPFNSTRKMSAVTFSNGETYAFGAPEYVLKSKNAQVDNLVKTYASKGFRVLLFAQCDGTLKDDKIPLKREPLAIVVIEDHIREDAAETIKWFKENGVDIKIISGDNPITVSEVSRRVGVENAEKYISLEGLSQQQVIDAVDEYTVFGRVSPEQKCILVKALKAKGHRVAMTGDGVNDILALKEADCSVAMASGSEATRLVSNLVLMDSNFSSMPSVVAEGRRVINNIQKSSSLFLMKTIYTILLSVFCLIVKTTYPFDPSQVLLLEMLVIGVPSFCLALQPNNERIKGKFLTNLLSKSLPGAIMLFMSVIACYLFELSIGTEGQYVTMAALSLTFVGLLVLFRLCKPFDIFRGVMFASMITLCILILALGNWTVLFKFVPLSLTNILFITCVVLVAYPCYDVVIKGLDKLFNLKKE